MLHQAQINRRKGFLLAYTTSFMWAILPIALKTVLQELDPVTTTWYRFSLAAVIQTTLMCVWRRFPTRFYSYKVVLLWIGAILGLVGNHTLFVAGLNYLQPVATTIFIQLAPVFLLTGSLIIFKETFNRRQWLGLAVLFSGMALFFSPELQRLEMLTMEFFYGAGFIVLAAMSWAMYALCQKQLLVHYTSRQVVTLVYLGGTLLLLPGSNPLAAASMNPVRIGLIIFAGINTFIGYGAFSEALNHWDASRVSAVLTTIPVQALFLMAAAQTLFPLFVERELLSPVKLIGALIVVAGSMTCALSRRHYRRVVKNPSVPRIP